MRDQSLKLSSGRSLGFAEYGDPHGEPMFYFHGWPSSRLQGELMDQIGKELGLRVIAPDRPGIGLSTFQPGRTLLDWPPVVEELAAHLGWERFHALGVSGGGPYVLVLAHAMPDRLKSAGVICGAPSLNVVGTRDLMWTYRLALWTQQHVPWLLTPGLALSEKLLALPPQSPLMQAYLRQLCPRDQEAMANPELYRMIVESGREGLRSSTRGLSADGSIYTADWGFNVASVAYPVCYWHGALDSNIPLVSVEKFVRNIPSATLTVCHEDGHYSLPLLGSREIVRELVRAAR